MDSTVLGAIIGGGALAVGSLIGSAGQWFSTAAQHEAERTNGKREFERDIFVRRRDGLEATITSASRCYSMASDFGRRAAIGEELGIAPQREMATALTELLSLVHLHARLAKDEAERFITQTSEAAGCAFRGAKPPGDIGNLWQEETDEAFDAAGRSLGEFVDQLCELRSAFEFVMLQRFEPPPSRFHRARFWLIKKRAKWAASRTLRASTAPPSAD